MLSLMQTVFDDVVVRKHPPDTVRSVLASQLEVGRRDPYRSVLASPLSAEPVAAPDGRYLTLWPRLDTLWPDDPAPWAEAGALLARLHRLPVPDTLPEHGGRRLVVEAQALAGTLHPGGSTDVLRILAGELLAAWPTPARVTLVYGDWHLGQLARIPGTGVLLLGQPQASALDALGVGDPAWDLARPAALWSVGLLPDADWHALLNGYADAGGPVPVVGRPWDDLDFPARCLLFRLAVHELKRGGPQPSEAADALLDAASKLVKWR